MAKANIEKHVHKLKRHMHKSGNATLFCTLPDCQFKINPAFALGKRSICWRCGNDFIMTEYSLRLAKPHCESCHKPKIKNEVISKSEIAYIEDVIADMSKPAELSLAERLTQMIHANKPTELEDEDI